MADMNFNYFTAAEAGQYTFYRIPKALFTEKQFQSLSCEAKVLYGMMLDRMGLSIQNQWFDSQGRAYIIFTVENVMEVMGCQSQKAVRLMKELDTVDGIGLIEKKRMGLGRPNLIYVKNFMSSQKGGGYGKKTSDSPECRGAAVLADTADAEGQDAHAGLENSENRIESRMDDGFGQKTDAETASDSASLEVSQKADGSVQEENWWDMDSDAETETTGRGQQPSNADAGIGTGSIENLCMPFAGFSSVYHGTGITAVSVDNVDNVDNHKNAALENQNSGCRNSFSKETAMEEKNHRFADREVEDMFRKIFGSKYDEGTESGTPEPESGAGRGQEFPETKHMGSEKQDSAAADSKIQEVREAKCNDTECNNTEFNETDHNDTNINDTDYFHVYQSYQSNQSYQDCQPCRNYPRNLAGQQPSGRNGACGMGRYDMDGSEAGNTCKTGEKLEAYRKTIRENIDYACFDPQEAENVDEFVELMADTMTVPDSQTIRVAGMDRPAPVVKSRFMKLAHSHIQYVMGCLQKHTGKIWNIRAYLMTALYNSTLTINNYYSAEARHDLYGCGC